MWSVFKMNEERMIRVCEQGADLIYDLLAKHFKSTNLQFMGNPIRWFLLEPVSPKDFKPKCYYIKCVTFPTGYLCDSCDISEQCIYARRMELKE